MEIIELGRHCFRDRLLQSYDTYLTQSANHRLAVGIVKGESFYVFGNGIAPCDQYDIGSISKTFTAHLVLHLESTGQIDLQQTADCYLPLCPGKYPTVLELLTHTAGYSHITPWEITVPNLLTKPYLRKNIYENCTKGDILKYLERRNHHKPANTYGYSDFSYALLALICESVTGTPFHILLGDFVNNRLSMPQTKILADPGERSVPAMDKHRTLPYWNWQVDNPYLASGGMVSNLHDMLQYLRIQLHSDEAFITSAHIRQDTARSRSNILPCNGWHTYKNSNQLWHVGGVGTFRSSILFNRKRDFGVVVLGNARGIRSANVHYLAKMVYGDLKSKKIKLP